MASFADRKAAAGEDHPIQHVCFKFPLPHFHLSCTCSHLYTLASKQLPAPSLKHHQVSQSQTAVDCDLPVRVRITTFVCASINSVPVGNLALTGNSHLRFFSSWIVPRSIARPQITKCGPVSLQAEGSGVFQPLPWQIQQVRTRKRGTEYQPKNIKRKRTHGWIKRLSSQGGIEVLLRRMLKGRKSLSH